MTANDLMAAALFDLDKTLVSKDTAGLFIRYEYEQGLTSAWRVARVAWWRLLYVMGMVDGERVARRVLEWYGGRSEEDLDRHVGVFFERSVLPLISKEGRRAVETHRQAGDVLAVVTASTRYVAKRVAAELGVEHVICTDLGVEDGKLSGRLSGPVCYGKGKLSRVRSFLSKRGESLELATLYTDSITDLPLLEAVGRPVAVNPDPRLAALARVRRWPVLAW